MQSRTPICYSPKIYCISYNFLGHFVFLNVRHTNCSDRYKCRVTDSGVDRLSGFIPFKRYPFLSPWRRTEAFTVRDVRLSFNFFYYIPWNTSSTNVSWNCKTGIQTSILREERLSLLFGRGRKAETTRPAIRARKWVFISRGDFETCRRRRLTFHQQLRAVQFLANLWPFLQLPRDLTR